MTDKNSNDTKHQNLAGSNAADEKMFKQWASGYVEQYGQELLQEQQMLDQQGIIYATPRADERVRQLTEAPKKRKKVPYFAAAAALLVLFVGISAVLVQGSTQLFDFLTQTQSAETSGDTASQIDKIQPLDFNLPAQFSVADVEWDNGETIYYLDNSMHDDVVLVVKKADDSTGWMREMDEIFIDDTAVPAKLKDEYKLLAFESRGQRYTISCRDDIETLSTLYRSVTEQDRKNV